MLDTMYKVQISLSALSNNIDLLSKNTSLFYPVIKSDAYGHGLVDIAKACLSFESSKKLAGFAVGNVFEAVKLREAGITEPILALLGEMPIEGWYDAQKAKEGNITLLVHDKETLSAAVENEISFALKWNTGMNRFGFEIDDLPSVLEYLENKKNLRFELSMSHLAMADDLSAEGIEVTNSQVEMLNLINEKVRAKFPDVKSSVGQSANVLANEKPLSDISRLGVSMYGVNPFYGTKDEHLGNALQPVMQVSAPVLAIKNIGEGVGIGYGLESKMPSDKKIAVVGIGYCDGYRRSYFSQKGKDFSEYGLYKDIKVRRVGRVCMQVTFFDVTGLDIKVGDNIYLLGGEKEQQIYADELGQWWETIAYEPLCQLGKTSNREIIK